MKEVYNLGASLRGWRWYLVSFSAEASYYLKKNIGQEPAALTEGAGLGCLKFFFLTLVPPISLSLSRLEEWNAISKGRKPKPTDQPI